MCTRDTAMKALFGAITALWFAFLLPVSPAFAQDRPAFGQEELDQMLAPIALYPDSLLSQILMASTYPLEVVQAARWSRANAHLKGEDAVQAVEDMDWDPSVKSLVAFPQVLSMMDEKLGWTERLGEAFLAQQPQVMDTIQALRRRAAAAGNLEPSEYMGVTRLDDHIIIEPPDPQLVHVPYYDPAVVYGPWWWPAYPPVFWGPPPGYYVGPAWSGFFWSSGIVISPGFIFGAFDWRHRVVNVVHVHHFRTFFNRRGIARTHSGPFAWRHDFFHRRGVPYRDPALRQEFIRSQGSGFTVRRESPPAQVAAPAAPAQQVERPRQFDGRSGWSRAWRGDPGGRPFRQEAASAGTVVQGGGGTAGAAPSPSVPMRRAQPAGEPQRGPRIASPNMDREYGERPNINRGVSAPRAFSGGAQAPQRAERGGRREERGARSSGERQHHRITSSVGRSFQERRMR